MNHSSGSRIPYQQMFYLLPLKTAKNKLTLCQGKLKIVAAIEDPLIIVKILKHLGLPACELPKVPTNYSNSISVE